MLVMCYLVRYKDRPNEQAIMKNFIAAIYFISAKESQQTFLNVL